jgi:alkylation response protein AidB-like acyl-CoA dehydrogenase
VKYISTILNITRVYSAVGSVGYLRKALDIARSFAAVRQIYSPNPILLKNNLLHMSELGKIAVTYRALTHLTFGAVSLLGKVECRTNESGVEERLRLLFPVVKGFCAEKGVEAMTECMVALGGQVKHIYVSDPQCEFNWCDNLGLYGRKLDRKAHQRWDGGKDLGRDYHGSCIGLSSSCSEARDLRRLCSGKLSELTVRQLLTRHNY